MSQETVKYYEHYKTKNIYELIGVGLHSETEERLVFYRSMKDGRMWARPFDMFFGTVKIDGVEYARFHWVWDHEGEEFKKKHRSKWVENGT